jgi:hypothetical protein
MGSACPKRRPALSSVRSFDTIEGKGSVRSLVLCIVTCPPFTYMTEVV